MGAANAYAAPVALLPYVKPALEISLNLFKTYVDLQNELRSQQFNDAAVSSIKSKLLIIENGIKRIEREASDLRDALIGDMKAAFLAEKISDLRSKWGSYNTHMGGKATLDEIDSNRVRDQAVQALLSLKGKVIDLIEEIKTRGGSNPLIVTPIFSGFSLIKAINARLIEDRNIFDSRERMQREFNDQLNEQFVKWRNALASPVDQSSLYSRKQKLKTELPKLKARVARFKMLDGDFKAEVLGNRVCPTSTVQVNKVVSAERSAACTVLRARENGFFGWSTMKLVLVDTRVRLTSHYGCPDSYFPAEMFDISAKRETTVSKEMDFSDAAWENPSGHFKRQHACLVETFETIKDLEAKIPTGDIGEAKPQLLIDLSNAAKSSNRAQAEMISVLSAWVFVEPVPTLDQDGSVFIGVSYSPTPQIKELFDVPLHLLHEK